MQLALLRSIKLEDRFVTGLRILQEQLTLLSSIKIEEEKLHAVNIDQAAYPPKTRIRPNRRLIVSLGTVVGLFLGIFLVFFVSFVQNQKETHYEQAILLEAAKYPISSLLFRKSPQWNLHQSRVNSSVRSQFTLKKCY